ncbi:MAG: hypothetical protein PPHEINF_2248 [uncultured Paraburkholderia sp.]|nr:MAG: hypothetical protein PPHEINF_2248 [uncultured Paraburkholderia sp.]CAH2786607.1 MAG: hypothetical protein PPHEESC_2207 [uncultured Paraburkholderia sp.]CAH2920945.1 MAG: hypothetical protein PPHERAN_2132 [uncultured Paraburkholderia sp.]CAH2921714.1 MAG: hypothetical protein PPHEMADMSA_2267 [uncultured Paraburkholderia sp.]
MGGIGGIRVNADVEMRGREAVPRADELEGGPVADGQVGIAQNRGLAWRRLLSSCTQYASRGGRNVSSRTVG